ncbi:MerR family transcriptional regulator [Paenibacillus arenilitoris]|uniref:MerR family transcriptional regulator n=1 Tax=Paenibacillus arenilitoris TaxID=2772299 RepID=A0A927CJ87_9BACL|nr:MerR family transcriptional regulator [Paenibacillus arenilitoris]MBD2869099.1 MerR family transcriptional regulator [Paenibacillus arenilitoris]
MKISQIAKMTGVSSRSLRHYEKKGLITVSRLDNNYREFDDSIIEAVNTIQLYLHLGLTTDQIKDIVYCPEDLRYDKTEDEYCEALLQIYETKLNEVIRQKRALDEAQVRLEKQINLMKENRDKWVHEEEDEQ